MRISDIIRDEDLLKKTAQKNEGNRSQKKVAVRDVLSTGEGTEGGFTQNHNVVTELEKKDALVIIKELYAHLTKTFSQIRKGDDLNITKLLPLARKFVKSLAKYERVYMLMAYEDYDSKDIVYHSIWTALYAVKIGRRLALNEEELYNLALSGLLHDVGLFCISEDIINRERQLFRSEVLELKKHPEKASRLIAKLGKDYDFIHEVVLEEHERINGSGFPNSLSGDEISLFAQIIGLADTYEDMTNTKPETKRKLPFFAIKEIIDTMKDKFNTPVIKAFLEEITLFPIGSYVRLNNQEIARVIGSQGHTHVRHVVEVLRNSEGERLKPTRIINLMESPLLYISEPIDEKEIPIE